MKNIKAIILTLSISFTFFFASAQTNIRYRYDDAGNRIFRGIYSYDPIEDDNSNNGDGSGRYANTDPKVDEEKIDSNALKIQNDWGVKVFPNPTQYEVNVNLSTSKNLESNIKIELLDASARVITSKVVNQLNNKIDLSTHKIGIYFIRVTYSGKSLIYKIEKI